MADRHSQPKALWVRCWRRLSEPAGMILAGVILVALVALLDWRITELLPLSFLYLLPMFLFGRALRPSGIVLFASICAALAIAYDDIPFVPFTGVPRLVLYFAAFVATGLFVREIYRNRQRTLRHMMEIEGQRNALEAAEQHLRALIETSPAAIVTADSSGKVLMANEAARRMLIAGNESLDGAQLQRFIPALTSVHRGDLSNPRFRAVMQTRGIRTDGETFLADVCFSVYSTSEGVRLTAMILDTSDDLRQYEESSLRQLMTGSRIAVGAMSHEIRNVCAAIAVVHQNLEQKHDLRLNEDFQSLGRMIESLKTLAGVELRYASTSCDQVDPIAVLDDLRIVLAPALRDADIEAEWLVDTPLPTVWADRSQLMQVFLNLANNSMRALASHSHGRLRITTRHSESKVLIEFHDNGGGVINPDSLFRPFQNGSAATGLGLYLSRAFVRSFGGDLVYLPSAGSATFIVQLIPADDGKELTPER